MRNRIEAIEVEAGLTWTASIMSALAILETHGGDKFNYLQDMRSEQGIGGDAMTAGFLYLAIAAGKYLDTRIEAYDHGVFSYEHLEHSEGELPWIFLEQFTPEEWISISNWVIPQERMEAIIDAWLDGPRFDLNRLDGSLTLIPKPPTELKTFEVEVRGMVVVSQLVKVTAVSALEAANDALSNTPRDPKDWKIVGKAVVQSFAGDVTEVASA